MNFHYARTTNIDLIKSVLFDTEIFERISEDGQLIDDIQIIIDESIDYIALYKDNILLGTGFIHPQNSSSCHVHINVLSQYRKYSKECGYLMLNYFIEQTNYIKFNTQVPVCYPDVSKFLTKFGFIYQGCDYKSINKKGIVHDQYLYGITRDQIIEQLKSR